MNGAVISLCDETGNMAEEVVIRKRGYFYRPNWQGYTASIHEAGRYLRCEAEKHAANCEGVTVHSPDEFKSIAD
jgi:hypothetical protein